jgi:hypothetical protein
VFRNVVLRRIFIPKREDVTGGWRKLHDEELDDLYSLQNIIRFINLRRMRWAGHVALMRYEKCKQKYSLKTRREETAL